MFIASREVWLIATSHKVYKKSIQIETATEIEVAVLTVKSHLSLDQLKK